MGPHRRLGDIGAVLGHQALVNPTGGVALLAVKGTLRSATIHARMTFVHGQV